MISDKSLEHLSMGVTISGVLILVIFAYSVEPTDKFIGNITENDIGKTVRIHGVLTDVRHDKNVFFSVQQDKDVISGIVFEKSVKNIQELEDMNEGDLVELVGKITSYKGSLEIIPTEIKPYKYQKLP